MVKVILIDDEKIALDQLKYLLEQYQEIQVQAIFTDPIEALERMYLCQPELVFLDIEMPEVNGLMVAEEIIRIVPDAIIVFITAYEEYALKAFELNAVDYILKPVSFKRIDKAIQKILKNLNRNKERDKKEYDFSEIRKLYEKGSNKIFAVEETGEIILLNSSDVLMFTSCGRDAIVHTKDKEYKTRQSLNYWEQRLAEHKFFRCHKSYLINFDKIERILPMFNNTYLLKIAGYPHEIPVSRNKAKDLNQILGL